MRHPLIAGNWKMNTTPQTAHTLLQQVVEQSVLFNDVEFAVFPPFPFLATCGLQLQDTNIALGAQNVSEYNAGAYTGEVSASMLKEIGCRFVIIGHSERRQLFAESNYNIVQKCRRVLEAKMTPILCVGETLAQRQKNQTLSVVQEQLAVVSVLKDNCANFSAIAIAYEPVWAIGTGRVATPVEAQIVHAAIREQLSQVDETFAEKTRILYGGSVKPDNAKALMAMPDIDGALVGGASLDAKSFLEIGRLCSNSF